MSEEDLEMIVNLHEFEDFLYRTNGKMELPEYVLSCNIGHKTIFELIIAKTIKETKSLIVEVAHLVQTHFEDLNKNKK